MASKTLYLTRHAKSSWDHTGMRDLDRPLNDRGERDAPIMAEAFRKRGDVIDLLISSPAVRAYMTAVEFANALGIPKERIAKEGSLYLASVGSWMRALENIPSDIKALMCFGHNPGISDLIGHLTGNEVEMTTCNTVRIDLHVDEWAAITRGTGSLAWHVRPADLG